MTVQKRVPFRDILSLQDRMNRVFEESLRESSLPGHPGQWMPHVDIFEDDACVTLKAELPGVKREDIMLDVSDGVLTLSGKKVFERDNSAESFHMMERRYGFFKRAFTLSEAVDIERIEARYNEGVLVVLLPKPLGSPVKRIPIIRG
jgi:HSP20 family protein